MAIQVIREVTADVVKRGVTRPVYAKQNDFNSRFLNVRIQIDGKDLKVDPVLKVILNVERPDQTENMFYGTVNVDDGTVRVPMTPWMLEIAGTLICDISLVSEDPDVAKLTTMQFNIYVEAATVADGEIQEIPEYNVLVDLIRKAESNSAPEVTEADDGKVLVVSKGKWCAQEPVQDDYTQNDSTAPDYIKNRPFYDGAPVKTRVPLRGQLLTERTLDSFEYSSIFSTFIQHVVTAFSLSVGKSYTVIWDGKEYKGIIAQDASVPVSDGAICIGNGSAYGLQGNNEPFAIVYFDGVLSIAAITDERATEHTLALYDDSVDYVTFAYNIKEGTHDPAECIESAEFGELWMSDWASTTVVWDGQVFECACQFVGAYKCIGNVGAASGLGADTGEPFVIIVEAEQVNGEMVYKTVIVDLEATGTSAITHAIELYINIPGLKKIDKKFLPDDIGGIPEVATSIDLSKFDSNGIIEETYASGTKTTTVEFDASGNPTKITDGDGNVITLTW